MSVRKVLLTMFLDRHTYKRTRETPRLCTYQCKPRGGGGGSAGKGWGFDKF